MGRPFMFVVRKNELKLLNDAYRSEKDELVVLYGRRRRIRSSAGVLGLKFVVQPMPIRLTQVGALGYDREHVRLLLDTVEVSASLP